jgi:hypothetical protein
MMIMQRHTKAQAPNAASSLGVFSRPRPAESARLSPSLSLLLLLPRVGE